MAKTDLTAQRARELLRYDPVSGDCFWIGPPDHRRPGPHPIRSKRNGYYLAHLDGYSFKLHRVIWLMTTGSWPSGVIDHINGNRLDNRWDNLRDVTQARNMQNLQGPIRTSTTGRLGVSRWGNRYRVQLRFCGKRFHVGYIDSLEAASAAYLQAKASLLEENWLSH